MRGESSPSFPSLVLLDDPLCDPPRSQLSFDQACVLVNSETKLEVLAQDSQCLQCDLLRWGTIEVNSTRSLLLTSRADLNLTLSNLNGKSCSFLRQFSEKAVYEVNVTQTECGDLITLRDPESAFLPLLLAFLVFLGIAILSVLVCRFVRSDIFKRFTALFDTVSSESENDLGIPSEVSRSPLLSPQSTLATRIERRRIRSLDAFRGLSIFVMIFVNYGGGGYDFFEHSAWDGITVADVVFPAFMWIMGLSLVLSLHSQLLRGVPRLRMARRALWRGFKLVLLGCVLNTLHGRNNLETLRYNGVLQRLGLCYTVVSLLEVWRMEVFPQHPAGGISCSWLRSLGKSWVQWIITGLLVTVNLVLTFVLPVPDCPTGYLGPGGLHDHAQYHNCTGGAAGLIDRIMFGESHLYSRPTCRKIYHTKLNYDPEGFLGTLTGILLVQLGAQAGRELLSHSTTKARVISFFIWAAITGISGALLSGLFGYEGPIPVNKNLYSLSFVLVTAALSFGLLLIFYLLVDHWTILSATLLTYAGMNPLLLYVGHSVTKDVLPWQWKPLTNSRGELLAMDLWGATLWLLIAHQLYHHDVFLVI